MNRMQKIAWTFVITISIAVISATIAVSLLYVKVGMPRATAGLGFLGLAGLAGIAPAIFRKDTGSNTPDERDKEINRRAALTGFAAAYLVVGLTCMLPFFIYGPKETIQIFWLPMIFAGAGLSHYFFYSVAILIQYSRGGKENE